MTKKTKRDISSSTDTGLCRDDKESHENGIGKINKDPETSSGGQKQTIYFGGGTPSILSHEEIREILECFKIPLALLNQVQDRFFIKGESKQENQKLEITFEANPEDITREYVEGLIELGINRLSMGVQTLNNKSLKEIRRSDQTSIIGALEGIGSALVCHPAKRDPFQNHLGEGENFFLISKGKSDSSVSLRNDKITKEFSVNIDFILGLPYTRKGETLESIQKLHQQFPFITHTSVYMLEDEDYPKHWKANSITEDEMQTEFTAIMDYFDSLGWHHYELSNWAKPGYESVHNRAYWDHSNTRGFGLSAASYEDRRRWNNSSSFGGYYRGEHENRETLTNEQIEIENMMFGIRTDGFDIKNSNISNRKLQENITKGFLKIENNMIKPTKTGIFVLDHIMSELL